LFDFTSAKSYVIYFYYLLRFIILLRAYIINGSIFIQDPELACSNEKYLIESLRNRLQDATEEKTNMQMALDFHLTELEDKKSKVIFGCDDV